MVTWSVRSHGHQSVASSDSRLELESLECMNADLAAVAFVRTRSAESNLPIGFAST
jgi:hypothetical protein